MWKCVTCHRFLWYAGWFYFVLFNLLVICLFIISSPNRLMPTALWFEQQEACNSVTHDVMIMSRALAGIHYLSYVSLNFSTHAINSFTKRTFYFQPFSVMAAHPIKLHPGLAEPIIGVQVLHVTSGIFSINVPGCYDHPDWQLDADTYSNAMLLASAAWDDPFVCREGTSVGPNAAPCRDFCTSAQVDELCREVGCWSQSKGAAKTAAFLQEPLKDGSRHVQVSLYADAWCCMDWCKVLEWFLLLLEYIGMSWVGFCPCWSSKDSHRKRAFSWCVAWPQISRVTRATVQELGEDGRRGVSIFFFFSIENCQPEVIGRVSMVLQIKIPDLLKKDSISVVKPQVSI